MRDLLEYLDLFSEWLRLDMTENIFYGTCKTYFIIIIID